MRMRISLNGSWCATTHPKNSGILSTEFQLPASSSCPTSFGLASVQEPGTASGVLSIPWSPLPRHGHQLKPHHTHHFKTSRHRSRHSQGGIKSTYTIIFKSSLPVHLFSVDSRLHSVSRLDSISWSCLYHHFVVVVRESESAESIDKQRSNTNRQSRQIQTTRKCIGDCKCIGIALNSRTKRVKRFKYGIHEVSHLTIPIRFILL